MSDSDDDLPILELIKKRKALEQNSSSVTKEKSKAGESAKRSKSAAETKSAQSQPSTRSNGPNNKSSDFYDTTQKGKLVQKLLVRWWYAMEWPRAEDIGEPPVGYESLDGFKGVFISTRTVSLGKLLDLRNSETCPNLKNFSKFSSTKIKDLCVTAYTKQMEVLAEHEGVDNAVYRQLRTELAEIKRIDCDKADKEARNYSF